MDTQAQPSDAGCTPCRASRTCAAALKKNRHMVAAALVDSLRLMPRWCEEVDRSSGDMDQFIKRELHVFVDYLHRLLHTGKEDYRHLYIGEKLKQTYDAGSSPEEAADLRAAVLNRDREVFLSALAPLVEPRALEYFDREIARIHDILSRPASKTLNILFIQDCLYLDIMAFLSAPLLEDGVRINPAYATSKNVHELRATLRDISKNKFDAVFFSPFTYEFSPDFSQVLQWRNSLRRGFDLLDICQRATAETQETLDLVSDLFDCPLFVHNTATVIREPSHAKRLIKNLVSRRTRMASARAVHEWLKQYVSARNESTFEHLFVVDERQLLNQRGEHALGAQFYSSDLQHPAVFGREMARIYRDLLFVQAHLLKKKLVVCDLDNTLWEGLIGEGEVRHYVDRQRTLKRLREKGIVLAINSKNDPANVHWRGAILCDDDFVCRQISWEPKVVGMKRIQEVLNLKLKDYIFIDDREDEREMVRSAFPDILTLDATAPRVWQLLDGWASVLESHPEVDRTLMYRQREERQRFLQAEEPAAQADPAALFKDLDLRLHIRDATVEDLKRVVELINRTNQFNLCATRTSFKEVRAWHDGARTRIVVAHASDRFGEMGMVCASVLTFASESLEITAFVLSCRVFGYGIENAVLNHIKRLGQGKPIKGWYKQTMQNGPCRDFLALNGFESLGDAWMFTGTECIPDPQWLSVSHD